MSFTAGILSVLFVLVLVLSAFLFGMAVSNLYHRHEQCAVADALRRDRKTLHDTYLLTENERWWYAHQPECEASQIIPLEFADRLSSKGRATIRIH